MSVLIRGVGMPKCCAFCPCEYYNGISDDYECWVTKREITDIFAKGLPDWCPLAELPEKHGRLVDADAVVAKYGDYYVEEGTEEGMIGDLRMLLELVPTVVEAEGKE